MGLGGTSAGALTSQTRANVLIDNALWAPLFTHTHMHTHKHYTLYALTLHSKCTYAAVLHATSIQIAQHAFLYQNTCDALTHTLTYPHLHLHSPSFTLTSQRSQTQTQSHSQTNSKSNHTRTHFCKCEWPERQREEDKYGSKSKSNM